MSDDDSYRTGAFCPKCYGADFVCADCGVPPRPSRAEVTRLMDKVEAARDAIMTLDEHDAYNPGNLDHEVLERERQRYETARAALLDAVCGKEGA